MIGRIDERAGRRRHQHADDAAQREQGADRPGCPALRLQIHAEKRAGARLHVGREETDSQ